MRQQGGNVLKSALFFCVEKRDPLWYNKHQKSLREA